MRVVAGSARGIPLNTIEGLNTRPTTDRVKEAVFSSLHHRIPGARGLDLFSGSGALGIELLSRGASKVTLVESHRPLEGIIKENLKKTQLDDRAQLMITDVYLALSQLAEPYDIIVMDPPYFSGDVEKVLTIIRQKKLLNPGGIIMVEHDIKDTFGYEGFVLEKMKKYGKIGVSFLVEAE